MPDITKMIMMFMMVMSLMFTQMKHPMTMGMLLLLQTMLTSMLTGMISQSFWFPYILTLMFLGGMMVLFIYITSIASNEMIQTSSKTIIIISMIMLTTIMLKYQPDSMNQETNNIMLININLLTNTMKLYNNSTNYITIMMASYLFITLIAIVKITNIFKGPLRKLNN